MKNPFLSRNPVYSVSEFIGRSKELQLWSQYNLENHNLIGLPRIGKTSLLYYLYYQNTYTSKEILGLNIWVQLTQLHHFSSFSFWKLMFEQFQIARYATTAIGTTPLNEESPENFFESLKTGIREFQKDTAYPITFFIDDFDVLLGGFTSKDLDWMRSLITNRNLQVKYIISSTKPLVNLIDEIGVSYSPLYNLFSASWIGLLAKSEAELLFQNLLFSEKKPQSHRKIGILIQEIGRHPALIKIASEYLLSENRFELSRFEDIKYHIRVDPQVQALYKQLFEYCKPEEQELLRLMANNKDFHSTPTLNLLRFYGLIEERGRKMEIFSDSFRDWLSKEISNSNNQKNQVQTNLGYQGLTNDSPSRATPNLHNLRQQITESFNASEIKTLSFELDIDHDNLPDPTREGLARELIQYCIRHKKIDELINLCNKLRPAIKW